MSDSVPTTNKVKRTRKPRAKSSEAAKELDRVEKQFDEFDSKVKELTLDRMNAAPKKEVEPQTQLSPTELAKIGDIYLKPTKTLGTPHKFNERFRDEWNEKKKYVQFIAENSEIIGDQLELWTYPYGGVPCEFWTVPVNKPVWGPRYLAEQISRCQYHRLTMQQGESAVSKEGTYYGNMVVDSKINRLDARPVIQSRSTFMGSRAF